MAGMQVDVTLTRSAACICFILREEILRYNAIYRFTFPERDYCTGRPFKGY